MSFDEARTGSGSAKPGPGEARTGHGEARSGSGSGRTSPGEARAGSGMTMWERLLQLVRLRRSGRRFFTLDAELGSYVSMLAEQERRPSEAVIRELLSNGLMLRSLAQENYQRWQALSPREQEVAALACLGYSNAQIGYRLVLSIDTVKTHMRHAMQKFNVSNRKELGMLLRDWDFSAWE